MENNNTPKLKGQLGKQAGIGPNYVRKRVEGLIVEKTIALRYEVKRILICIAGTTGRRLYDHDSSLSGGIGAQFCMYLTFPPGGHTLKFILGEVEHAFTNPGPAGAASQLYFDGFLVAVAGGIFDYHLKNN